LNWLRRRLRDTDSAADVLFTEQQRLMVLRMGEIITTALHAI